MRESGSTTAVDIEARNIFTARNPIVVFATIIAIGLVGGSALTTGRGSALEVIGFGALLVGAFYFGIGWWQRTEIGRVFLLIERVVSAGTVDEARSIGLTDQ